MRRVVLVPGVPALLPEYRSLQDPVAPLRAACLDAVAWLGPAPRIVADPLGERVAVALLEEVARAGGGGPGLDTLAGARYSTGEGGVAGARYSTGEEGPAGARYSTGEGGDGGASAGEGGVLVVGNGSARRSDASPGPFDERAAAFDEALGAALRGADRAALAAVDTALAEELWASVGSFPALADALEGARLVGVDHDDAPYGVQYWVMRWQA